jgi:hypothetical protein
MKSLIKVLSGLSFAGAITLTGFQLHANAQNIPSPPCRLTRTSPCKAVLGSHERLAVIARPDVTRLAWQVKNNSNQRIVLAVFFGEEEPKIIQVPPNGNIEQVQDVGDRDGFGEFINASPNSNGKLEVTVSAARPE